MRKFILAFSALVAGAAAMYGTGSATPPAANARALIGADIREMTIKAHLEVGPNYEDF